MIDIEIRDKNRIVTLSASAKTPIRSRNGSSYFYNSMELLCIAVGSCFGKELVQYCIENSITPRIFESIKITVEDFVPKIILSHPKDTSTQTLEDIRLVAISCPIAKLLYSGIKIEFITNATPTENLVDELKNTGCCGGRHA